MTIELDLQLLQRSIGNTVAEQDRVDPRLVARMSAALNRDSCPANGEALPLPWHWLLFSPIVRADQTGTDGHPARGGFVPDIPLPRRMWAGSQVEVKQALRVGDTVQRRSTITDVQAKSGRSGPLVFVTIAHEIQNAQRETAISETQQLVFREAPRSPYTAPAGSGHEAPAGAQWQHLVSADELLLFRYSALTYNGHRIHYDRSYATEVEGYPGLVVHGCRDGQQVRLWALSEQGQLAVDMRITLREPG
jgi:3-methylfumaryl-CoA hydratase